MPEKWASEVCRGFAIHVIDPQQIQTFPLGLAIMRAAMDLAPQGFAWKQPPYEYDYTNLPINLILGHLEADRHLTQNFLLDNPFWKEGCAEYSKNVETILIYPRKLHPGSI